MAVAAMLFIAVLGMPDGWYAAVLGRRPPPLRDNVDVGGEAVAESGRRDGDQAPRAVADALAPPERGNPELRHDLADQLRVRGMPNL
jgi:hypothetical protein